MSESILLFILLYFCFIYILSDSHLLELFDTHFICVFQNNCISLLKRVLSLFHNYEWRKCYSAAFDDCLCFIPHIEEFYVYGLKPVESDGSFSLACFFWKIVMLLKMLLPLGKSRFPSCLPGGFLATWHFCLQRESKTWEDLCGQTPGRLKDPLSIILKFLLGNLFLRRNSCSFSFAWTWRVCMYKFMEVLNKWILILQKASHARGFNNHSSPFLIWWHFLEEVTTSGKGLLLSRCFVLLLSSEHVNGASRRTKRRKNYPT